LMRSEICSGGSQQSNKQAETLDNCSPICYLWVSFLWSTSWFSLIISHNAAMSILIVHRILLSLRGLHLDLSPQICLDTYSITQS
jgi:hypothetical protein